MLNVRSFLNFLRFFHENISLGSGSQSMTVHLPWHVLVMLSWKRPWPQQQTTRSRLRQQFSVSWGQVGQLPSIIGTGEKQHCDTQMLILLPAKPVFSQDHLSFQTSRFSEIKILSMLYAVKSHYSIRPISHTFLYFKSILITRPLNFIQSADCVYSNQVIPSNTDTPSLLPNNSVLIRCPLVTVSFTYRYIHSTCCQEFVSFLHMF